MTNARPHLLSLKAEREIEEAGLASLVGNQMKYVNPWFPAEPRSLFLKSFALLHPRRGSMFIARSAQRPRTPLGVTCCGSVCIYPMDMALLERSAEAFSVLGYKHGPPTGVKPAADKKPRTPSAEGAA
jgi:hypothetical protein